MRKDLNRIDNLFPDEFEFADDIHGPIHLNCLERDVVDTPEFQRLFRLGQLGFVDLVFPTANHTRGAHSLGATYWAKRLVRTLRENQQKFKKSREFPSISRAEEVLISLGALTHDLPHGPYSHDIEKKTHLIFPTGDPEKPKKVKSYYGPYDKHDDFLSNPALFVYLMDEQKSVLARVLRRHSGSFLALLRHDAQRPEHEHLAPFVAVLARWPGVEDELLPSLLFHLLSYEKLKEAWEFSRSLIRVFNGPETEWGMGPEELRKELHETWYQPFRHDIIGDTLSADLLDYLMRDQSRLGMKNELDFKLLNYYVMVKDRKANGKAPIDTRDGYGANLSSTPRYTCAIDLHDHKRGTFRSERLNDIFRLLDIRHQIHEKAVYHRVVQSAIAMLSRTGLILTSEWMPKADALYGLDKDGYAALSGDEQFLANLVQAWNKRSAGESHQGIAVKLAERRVYRPLMVIPGDRVPLLLSGRYDSAKFEYVLRELAAIVDSPFFSSYFLVISAFIEALLKHAIASEQGLDEHVGLLLDNPAELRRIAATVVPKGVIFWTTPYKQLYKDPAILVCADEDITARIDDLQKIKDISEPLRRRVEAGIHDAEAKNEAMWKLYVFLSDGLFYTGACAKVLGDHPCQVSADNHTQCLTAARNVVARSIRNAWEYWLAKERLVPLDEQASQVELEFLLRSFIGHRGMFDLQREKIVSKVSAVEVAQYVHGDNAENCRDVRYKFDGETALDEILESCVDQELREPIKKAIAVIGLKAETIPGEELTEIVVRLSRDGARLQELLRSGRSDPRLYDELVRKFWLGELNIGVARTPTSARETRVPISAGVNRMDTVMGLCKIVLTRNFSKYEPMLGSRFEARFLSLDEKQFATVIGEFERSARASKMSEERRAEGPENESVFILETFLEKLLDKVEGK